MIVKPSSEEGDHERAATRELPLAYEERAIKAVEREKVIGLRVRTRCETRRSCGPI